MLKCPKCESELLEYDYCGISFQICKKCGSVLISQDNFALLSNKIDNTISVPDLFLLDAITVNEATRKCTKCDCGMAKILYEGVVIDICKSCKMLMFDNGELSKFYCKFSKLPMEIMNNALFLRTYCSNANYQAQVQDSKIVNLAINKSEKIDEDRKVLSMQIQSKEKEKIFNPVNGFLMVAILLFCAAINLLLFFVGFIFPPIYFVVVVLTVVLFFCLGGFITVKPQEAYVLTLFGKYVGTIKKAGFFWKNPFISAGGAAGILATPISLKARTLDNGKQKINDEDGNPIEVGIMVTWEVCDTAMAEFNVDDYVSFLSAQCDSVLRRIIRQYPYDAPEESNKETLRGDSAEISEKLKIEIQNAVIPAGLHIIDARITHLAYSSEIAVAMLQRQQANAVIAAKSAIVNGAVDMVEMALEKLSKNDNLVLNDSDKAKMVNNLLVVLCGNKESQPVIKL